ncbi:MAG: cytochrome c biogenesis protein ResB [Pseudomonadota bacterium]
MSTSPTRRRPAITVWAFLASMNFAITLLVVLSLASVIGTVLQQNQPWNDYIIKFGPFWFDVFRRVELFNVYGSSWFMLILLVLLVSTSTCILRNWPAMLREMRNWRERVQHRSLRAMSHHRDWQSSLTPTATVEKASALLRARGYSTRVSGDDSRALLSAKRGNWNRIGYLFTHGAIVIICVGALLDSSLAWRFAELLGKLQPETRNIPASQVPPISRLPIWNPGFRGNVNIPEGSSAKLAFVPLRDGYLVQDLPFTIEVEAFRVEHHITGQPKSFESDLIIHDDSLDEPFRQTIRVNHPLTHRGYTVYQSSFGDGGTRVVLNLWPLDGVTPAVKDLQGNVLRTLSVTAADGPRTIELDDFRLFNINPVLDDNGEVEQRNFGPALQFKVRQSNGQAVEYFNYMSPVMINGTSTLLSGRRTSVAEEFEYLHIPADKLGTATRFLNLVETLQSPETMQRVVRLAVLGEQALQASDEQIEMADAMGSLVPLFISRGFAGVENDIEQRVPEAQRDTVREAYLRVLQRILTISYLDVLTEEGVLEPDAFDELWLENAINALNGLSVYGAPFYLQMTQFEHRESTGLQIAKSPGKGIVYFGSTLLMIGVFLLFYVQQRRLWLSVQPSDTGAHHVVFAGVPERALAEFDREFDVLAAGLEANTRGATDEQPGTAPASSRASG